MLGFFPHYLSNSFSEAVCKVGTWVCCSVAQSCPILCNPMERSTPGFPVLHYLPEFPQTSCPLWCYTHTHTHTHTRMEQTPPSDLLSLWRLESMRFQKSTKPFRNFWFNQILLLGARIRQTQVQRVTFVGGVCNFLGSVSSQQKFEVTDQCYSPWMDQCCVTAQFYLESKGKYIVEEWGHADPKDSKRRERSPAPWLLFSCVFSPPPGPALCKLG